MKKALVTVATLAAVLIALVVAAHHIDLLGIMKRLHGG
jgi:hypothetical protein